MFEREFLLDDIPLLAMAREPHGPYPGTVLLYHGLLADKETHRKELEQLAERGFLAVGVDAHGHGRRALTERPAFLDLVRSTVEEIPRLLERLSAMEATGPFGITGISMGGYVAFAAPQVTARVRAVVPILGSPIWADQPDSPHLRPEAYREVALMAWNAGRDVNVPPGPARELVGALGQSYHEYPESDHFMRPEDWEDGWRRTLDWFQAHLAGR